MPFDQPVQLFAALRTNVAFSVQVVQVFAVHERLLFNA